MTNPQTLVVSPPGAGREALAFGRNLIRMTAEETGGRLGMLEITLSPGEGTPVHVHEREDEFFRVLSGRFGFWCGDAFAELEEGGCILLPRGIAHRFQNVGPGEGKVMVVVTPGGFEGFFSTMAEGQVTDPVEIFSIAASFGLRFQPAEG